MARWRRRCGFELFSVIRGFTDGGCGGRKAFDRDMGGTEVGAAPALLFLSNLTQTTGQEVSRSSNERSRALRSHRLGFESSLCPSLRPGSWHQGSLQECPVGHAELGRVLLCVGAGQTPSPVPAASHLHFHRAARVAFSHEEHF